MVSDRRYLRWRELKVVCAFNTKQVEEEHVYKTAMAATMVSTAGATQSAVKP